MRVPENWLRSMVNPPMATQALADTLTMAGLEVEEVEALAPEFSGVVVARVLSTEKHPDADRLRVCRVDTGAGGEPLQIVCGAPNVVPNMVVACATEGAVLPGGFKIKRAKMRGVESQGMLCSAKELGIAEDAEGLMALPESLGSQLGKNVREALSLDAQVLTLKLTPNRADCLSIAGVAREVAALTGVAMCATTWPKIASSISDRLAVKIQAPDLCGRFSGRVMKGVNAKAPTPDWMRERLEQAGQRSISALVDISNYVMLELGRPSHIFDLDKVSGDLTVRWANAGESLLLLNGQTVSLDSSVGVIADAYGPEAMAGIMGGERTSVSLDTQNIYIEAAFWWPDAIRGRARKYNFTTEAGHRFERGVDWATTTDHVDYITHLIQTICGGQAGPLDDQQGNVPARPPVQMRLARCNKILGLQIVAAECLAIFQRLGFNVEMSGAAGSEVFTVVPPSFRFDIEIEEDLIEEVARVYGFERITARPPVAPIVMSAPAEASRSAMQLRDRLVDQDYFEAITYSFISEKAAADFSREAPLALLNPMASHQSVMRTSLLPGLLDSLATNVARKQSRVRLFEIGRSFHDAPSIGAGDWTVKGIDQPLKLAGLAFGPAADDQWGQPSRLVDFFDVKADLEALVAPLRLSTQVSDTAHIALHPGRSAQVLLGQDVIGVLGELHPRLVQEMELPSAPVVFELLLAPILALDLPRVSEVSKFPPVTRDLAVVVDTATPAGAIMMRLQKLKNQLKQGSWLTNIKCFDEYRGKGLSEKEKSLAFRFILQSSDATLQDPEVDALMAEILKVLQSDFAARLRS
ncbi:phenylalanine--tRNA ligase subunit beta [beta proteobacterium MWH-UniP1]